MSAQDNPRYVKLDDVWEAVKSLPCSHADSADLGSVCRSCRAGHKQVDAADVQAAIVALPTKQYVILHGDDV